jgi:hypothetical protein
MGRVKHFFNTHTQRSDTSTHHTILIQNVRVVVGPALGQVLEWKRSKILSLARPGWNFSNQPAQLIPPKVSATNLEVGSYNLAYHFAWLIGRGAIA